MKFLKYALVLTMMLIIFFVTSAYAEDSHNIQIAPSEFIPEGWLKYTEGSRLKNDWNDLLQMTSAEQQIFIDALIQAIDKNDGQERKEAIIRLTNIFSQALKSTLQWPGSMSPWQINDVRKNVLDIIIPEKVIPSLINVVKDDDSNCVSAAKLIGEFGSCGADAIPVLVAAFLENRVTSQVCANVLSKIYSGAKCYAPELTALLESEDESVLIVSSKALRFMEPIDESIPALEKLLAHNSENVRERAALTLFIIKNDGPINNSLLRLVLNESYVGSEYSIEGSIIRFIQQLGVTVLPEQAEEFDSTLIVDISGSPKSGTYGSRERGSEYLTTGAKINVKLKLCLKDGDIEELEFTIVAELPKAVWLGQNSLPKAPYAQTINGYPDGYRFYSNIIEFLFPETDRTNRILNALDVVYPKTMEGVSSWDFKRYTLYPECNDQMLKALVIVLSSRGYEWLRNHSPRLHELYLKVSKESFGAPISNYGD